MPTTAPTPREQRADLQRQIDQLDLERLNAIKAVFAGEAFASVVADLKALADPNDTTALHRSASADPDALLANVILPLENGPNIADALAARLDAKLNPPAEPATPAAPVPPASE